MLRLQEFIHGLEMGQGSRIVSGALVLIALAALAVVYDATRFRNLATQEGMDAAQLARNLAEGRGFTTQLVRPLSVYLLERHQPDQGSRLQDLHPDLAQAPLYPLLLAGVLKLMPFAQPELSPQAAFTVYQPDLWIAIFNQVLFLMAVWLVFRFARRWFDDTVAWLSALTFLGAEVFWRFSLSGLSTLLAVLLFVALAGVLARLEAAAREEHASGRPLGGLAAAAGGLVGLGCLTRYAFGWLMVVTALWILLYGGQRRARLAGVAAAVFCLVVAPWIARNWALSGTPFGTAGYVIYQQTPLFTGDQMERTLHPSFSGLSTDSFSRKFWTNAAEMIKQDLPQLGGSWIVGFFLAGLLVPFRSLTLSRLRYWLLACLALLFVVQAFGRAGSTESSVIRTDNLLILAAPLVFVYGASLVSTLTGQLRPAEPGTRWVWWIVLTALACAPLIVTFLAPRESPVVYPPYYPPWIAAKCRHVPPDGLVMSDVPAAVAWYGNRQSIWLTLKHQASPADKFADDFYEVHRRKPLSALYLSAKTTRSIDTTAIWQPGAPEIEAGDWARFVLGTYLRGEVPSGFPLRVAPEGLGPEIFLTDSER